VMWPYGYTRTNVPSDMTSLDHLALRDIGRHMAKTNGYTPEQGSDLYITHGGSRDYLYGTYRIFAYTFEMSVRDYPKTRMIAPETGRNKEAVLWLAERAWCPLSILGASVRQVHCGALDDDFEVARGWIVNPDGTDTAPASDRFARGNPSGTSAGGMTLQPSSTPSGRAAFVTGLAAGSSAGSNDLDALTTIRSTPITLPSGTGQRLGFRWLFAHGTNSSSADHLRAIVEEGGTRTVVWERTGSNVQFAGAWRTTSLSMDPWAGHTIRLRFEALDGGSDSTVESGIDDLHISRPTS
jgi:carboxypeptidase T